MVEHTAGAARTRGGVLSGRLVAGAVESVLLAAGALGLGSTDTASAGVGLAAGGVGVDHFSGFWWWFRSDGWRCGSNKLDSSSSFREI